MILEFPWVPWESHGNGKHRLNSWEWEWEWWTGYGREMGIVVWKKFPLVALELACLYFVADILSLDLHCILLFYNSGTELFLMPSWFFGSGSGGNGTK